MGTVKALKAASAEKASQGGLSPPPPLRQVSVKASGRPAGLGVLRDFQTRRSCSLPLPPSTFQEPD